MSTTSLVTTKFNMYHMLKKKPFLLFIYLIQFYYIPNKYINLILIF